MESGKVCVRSVHMTLCLDRIFGFPGPRQQLVEPVDGMSIDHAREHVGEVSVGFDAVEFAGLCRPPNYAEPAKYGMSLSRWHR